MRSLFLRIPSMTRLMPPPGSPNTVSTPSWTSRSTSSSPAVFPGISIERVRAIGVAMNQFFESLGQDWVDAAQRRGADIDRPALDSRVALELLELARVAAHTQERRFAPLTSYLAGVAAERLRSAAPDVDDEGIAGFIQEGRRKL